MWNSNDCEGEVTLGGRKNIPTATFQFQDEISSVRFRNKSYDADETIDSEKSKSLNGSPGLYSTPTDDLKKNGQKRAMYSPDSGFETSFSFASTPPSQIAMAKLKLKEKRQREEETVAREEFVINSPLDALRRRWRRRTALFDTEPAMGFKDVMPYMVLLTIIASSAFTVVMLRSMIDRDGGLWRSADDGEMDRLIAKAAETNGKYASIVFGHKQRIKRLAEEGRMLLEDGTVDEEGLQLGGKRASLQYIHKLMNSIKTDEKGDVSVGELFEIRKIYDNLVAESTMDQEAEDKRKMLIEKIQAFGHFTTSKLKPLELDEIKSQIDATLASVDAYIQAENVLEEPAMVNEVESEKVKQSKRTVPKGQSAPFRFHKGQTNEMSARDTAEVAATSKDDPFRFV